MSLCQHCGNRITITVCAVFMAACVQVVPADLLEKIEAVDQKLIALQAPESARDEYADFIRQWVSLKARVQSEDDLIRWPWETPRLEEDLRRLQDEGDATVARLHAHQVAQRHLVESKLASVEERLQLISTQVESIEGHIVLGDTPVEAELLLKQARAYYEQHAYARSMETAERASRALLAQTTVLTRELGRYADNRRIAHWRAMAQETIAWSGAHHTTAIVVSKADRLLTLYKNGRKVRTFAIRLGFNGIREKHYQTDGATPEGRYRVVVKRGQGQTPFYRALLLDYPNAADRQRFERAKISGRIPPQSPIGGPIEIHGAEKELMAQTLGCITLDDPQMLALFNRVSPGTPVTIVGALTDHNSVALALAQLATSEEDT